MKFSCCAVVFFLAYDVAGNRSRRRASQEAVLSNGPLVGGFCFGRLCSFLYMDDVPVGDGPR